MIWGVTWCVSAPDDNDNDNDVDGDNTFSRHFWFDLGVRICDIFSLSPKFVLGFGMIIAKLSLGSFALFVLSHPCVSQVLTPKMSHFF